MTCQVLKRSHGCKNANSKDKLNRSLGRALQENLNRASYDDDSSIAVGSRTHLFSIHEQQHCLIELADETPKESAERARYCKRRRF